MTSERLVPLRRWARIPDPVRLARYRHVPELGPRPLFFSGGTALRGASQKLIEYTHHSMHLITPFDSGGSSATLRKAFRMPAVGDLRSRLMALADHSVLGNPEIYDLFAFRFPEEGESEELGAWLDRMVRGRDARVRAIPEPMRSIVRNHLGFLRDAMPEDFDLRGANIGNLVLAGGYLNHRRRLDPVLYLFTRLVEVRGVVRPIVDKDLHLVARLADGRELVGQHRITGHRRATLSSPVERIWLSRSRSRPSEYRPAIPETVDGLIREADLICYPIGSFYTSLVATLLPQGVADAVAATDVPKVYVPNPSHDPEEIGTELPDRVRTLMRVLSDGATGKVATDQLLQYVMLDVTRSGVKRATLTAMERMGVQVVDVPLVTDESAPWVDDRRLIEALLSMT